MGFIVNGRSQFNMVSQCTSQVNCAVIVIVICVLRMVNCDVVLVKKTALCACCLFFFYLNISKVVNIGTYFNVKDINLSFFL